MKRTLAFVLTVCMFVTMLPVHVLAEEIHEHAYVGEITIAPSCVSGGLKTYTCSCGDSYTEDLPAIGHSYTDGICAVCGESDPNYVAPVIADEQNTNEGEPEVGNENEDADAVDEGEVEPSTESEEIIVPENPAEPGETGDTVEPEGNEDIDNTDNLPESNETNEPEDHIENDGDNENNDENDSEEINDTEEENNGENPDETGDDTENGEDNTGDVTSEPEDEEITGECGEHLTWKIKKANEDNDTFILTVSGSGDMDNYDAAGDFAPWYEYANRIVGIDIGASVTGIGTYAFLNCSEVKYISLPDAVVSVGSGAFKGCSSLVSLKFGSDIQTYEGCLSDLPTNQVTVRLYSRQSSAHAYFSNLGYNCAFYGITPENCNHENLINAAIEVGTETEECFVNNGSSEVHDIYVRHNLYQECPDCGYVSDAGWGEDECVGQGAHVYENGICAQCGYACQHMWDANGVCGVCGYVCQHDEGTYSIGWEEDEPDYICEDARNHTMVQKHHEVFACARCGARVATGETTEYNRLTGYCHSYVEKYESETGNICAECGYENTCAHKNSWRGNDWYGEVQRIDNGSNRYHTANGMKIDYDYCGDCGIRFNEGIPYEYSDEQAWHSYTVEGVCTECNHICNCTHENLQHKTEISDWGNVEYTNTENNRTHQVDGYGYEYKYCPDCNRYMDYVYNVYVTSAYDHSYSRDGNPGVCDICGHVCTHDFNVNGYCEACGYQCQHTNIDSAAIQTRAEANYDNRNNGTEATHDVYINHELYQECAECGYQRNAGWTEWEYSGQEAHVYDGGNGYCVKCSYWCQHPGLEAVEAYSITDTEQGYLYVDNTNHAYGYITRTYKDCAVCGMAVLISEEMSSDSEESGHSYDENGYCPICYYNCQHEWNEGICGNCGYICMHDVGTNGNWERTEEGYRQLEDVRGHICLVQYWDVHVCARCGYEVARTENGGINEEYSEHSYVNKAIDAGNVCEKCGYENTCAHESIGHSYEWIDQSAERYEDYGSNAYHNYTAIAIEYDFCGYCGVRWNISAPYERTEQWNHNYDENEVCSICNHENTCTHENRFHRVIINDWNSATYEMTADNYRHTGIGTGWQDDYCPDCCTSYNYEGDVEVRAEQNHSYTYDGTRYYCVNCGHECTHEFDVNGYCPVCGYLCQHTNIDSAAILTRAEASEDYRNNYNTAEGHEVYVQYEQYRVCPDCGAKLGIGWTEWEYNRQEAHVYENGNSNCVKCGYWCQHPDIEEATAYEVTDSEKSYRYIDNTTHAYGYVIRMYKDCSVCGARICVSDRMSEDYEAYVHSFDENGMCTVCSGWCSHEWNENGVCGNCGKVCEHTQENWRQEEVNPEYEIIGSAREHIKHEKRRDVRYCENCGKIFEYGDIYEVNSYAEQHSYVNKAVVGEESVCAYCGYENTCNHENYGHSWSWVNDVVCVDIGINAYHNYTGVIIEYDVCYDCGVWLNVSEPHEYTDQPGHIYNSEGVCTECGHICDCTHTNKEHIVGFNDWESVRYTEIAGNNRNHQISGYGWEYDHCADCLQNFNQRNEAEVTGEREHSYNRDGNPGVCNNCGHVCTHDFNMNGYCEACGYWCPHNGLNEAELETSQEVSEECINSNSPNGHDVFVGRFAYRECPDCGYRYNENWAVREYAGREAHVYNNGICTICGYNCRHTELDENSIYSVTDSELVYQPVDNRRHTYGSITHTYGNCTVCGTLVTKNEISAGSEESHTYDENGYCSLCGHNCSHVWNINGVCSICGYECMHDCGSYYGQETYVQNCTPQDACYHIKVAQTRSARICSRCGATVEIMGDYGEANTYTEYHSYYWKSIDEVGNVCADCGYVNLCTHENYYSSRDWIDMYDLQYEEINGDNKNHIRAGMAIEYKVCNTCGVKFEVGTPHEYTEMMSHSYSEDGICLGCGHICDCAHENRQHNYGIYDWDSAVREEITDNNMYHQVSGLGWEQYYCPDCQRSFNYADNVVVTGEEQHSYSYDGSQYTCRICDHVCTHNFNKYGYCEACHYQCSHININDAELKLGDSMGERCIDDGLADGHNVYAVYTAYRECPECGYHHDVGSVVGEILRQEPHIVEEGSLFCTVCGYSFCPHTAKEERNSWVKNVEEASFISCGIEGHTCGGIYTVFYYCPTCERSFYEEEYREVTEKHTYDNYVCTKCRFEHGPVEPNAPIPDHPGWYMANPVTYTRVQNSLVEPVYEWEYLSPIYHASLSTGCHNITAEYLKTVYCPACHQYICDNAQVIETIEEEHIFIDGVCACGAVQCNHTNTSWGYVYDDEASIVCETNGYDRHKKTSTAYYATKCNDCGAYISWNILNNHVVYEDHIYVDGVCTLCGQVACTHENMQYGLGQLDYSNPNFSWDLVTYESIDNAKHIKYGVGIIYDYCPTCYKRFNVVETDRAPVIEQHTYTGLQCDYCKHLNTCSHVNTVVEMMHMGYSGDHYEPDTTGNQHIYVGSVCRMEVCSDCGKQFDGEILNKQRIYEDHEWDNESGDHCIICGCERGTITTAGENINWQITENGSVEYYDDGEYTHATYKLELTGNGPMCDYLDSHTVCPWNNERDWITEISIGEGIIVIGMNAFTGMKRVSGISLPNSLTRIEAYAFSGCSLIQGNDAALYSGSNGTLHIPENVSYIGEKAFSEVYPEYVELPANMTYIAADAFESRYFKPKMKVFRNTYAEQYCIDNDFTYKLRTYNVESGITDNGIEWTIDTYELNIPDYNLHIACGDQVLDASDLEAWADYAALINCIDFEEGVTAVDLSAFTAYSGVDIFIPESAESLCVPENAAFGNVHVYLNSNAMEYCLANDIPFAIRDTENLVKSGNCGESATYELFKDLQDGTYTLVISGSGDMTSHPWYTYNYNDENYNNEGLKNVIISNGITSICESAFYNASKLTSITLPDSITVIGNHAFSNTGLTFVAIPEGVTTIDRGAFSDSKLNSVELPDSLVSIGYGAFYSTELESVELPAGLRSIEDEAFGYTPITSVVLPAGLTSLSRNAFGYELESIEVDEGNTVYKAVNGCIYTYDGTELVYIPYAKTGRLFVENGTTRVTAFFEGKLSEVIIPEGVTYLDTCCRMMTITVPESVTEMNVDGLDFMLRVHEGSYAHQYCIDLWINYELIPDEPFNGDSGDIINPGTAIHWEINTDYELHISGYGDMGNTIPWKKYNRQITSVTIEPGLTGIGNGAFENCYGLTEIVIPYGVTYIGDAVFNNCKALKRVQIPGSVETLGKWVFNFCRSLENVIIPEGVKSIGVACFMFTENLTLTIPESVISMGMAVFEEAPNLVLRVHADSYALDYANNLYNEYKEMYGDLVFRIVVIEDEGIHCSHENMDITSIRAEFKNEEETEYTYVNSITHVRSGMGRILQNCLDCGAIISGDEQMVTVEGNHIWYDGSCIYCHAAMTCGNDVVWSLVILDRNAGISSVTISGSGAIRDYSVDDPAPWNDAAYITINSGVTGIGAYAFANSSANITVPATVAYIGENAFGSGCTITVYCGSYAQMYCDAHNLDYVLVPDQSIGGDCGDTATWFISEENGAVILTISGTGAMWDYSANDAPWKNYSITKLVIEDGITGISSYAFDGCVLLSDVSLGNGVDRIESYAFNRCYSLKSIGIPYNVTYVSPKSFKNCPALADIVMLGEKPLLRDGYMHYRVESGCLLRGQYDETVSWDLIDELVLVPEGIAGYLDLSALRISRIGDGAFENCKRINGIKLSGRVYEIGDRAFSYMQDADIIISDGTYTLGSELLYGCRNVKITIPPCVTEIGENMMANAVDCKALVVYPSIACFYCDEYGINYEEIYSEYSGELEGVLKEWVTDDGVVYTLYNSNHLDIKPCIGEYDKSLTFNNPVEDEYRKNIRGITVHNGITSIGCDAFFGFRNVYSITLPESLDYLNSGAFANCDSLAELTIPYNVSTIDTIDIGTTWYEELKRIRGLYVYSGSKAQDLCDLYGIPYRLLDYVEDEPELLHGVCGDNIEWRIDEIYADSVEYRLILTGYGDMYSYTGKAPWAGVYQDQIVEIVCDGIMPHLSAEAFTDMTAVTGVVLPEGLTEIPYRLLSNCTNLESINIPETVTEIDSYAFAYSGISTISIPESVVDIDWLAFQSTTNLMSIEISENNQQYSSFDGAIYNKDGSKLIFVPGGLSTYAIRQETLEIAKDAFSGSAIKTVTIPEGLTTISERAFYGSELESISIPSTVTEIGKFAFGYCPSLTSIVIPGGVKTIAWGTFIGCDNLRYARLSEGVEEIKEAAFAGCDMLMNLELPESLRSIETGAFPSHGNLSALIIPEGVVSFYEDALTEENVLYFQATLIVKEGSYVEQWCHAHRSVTYVLYDKAVDIGVVSAINERLTRYMEIYGDSVIGLEEATGVAGSLDISLITYTVSSDGDDVEVTSVAFDVTPVDENGDIITNDRIHSEITFRLPVPDELTGDTVSVYHSGEYIGTYEVQGATGGRYVEIVADSFSEYSYRAAPANVAVAMIGDDSYESLEAAFAAVETGDTIILSADSDEDLTVPAVECTLVVPEGISYTGELAYNSSNVTGNKYNYVYVCTEGDNGEKVYTIGNARINTYSVTVGRDLSLNWYMTISDNLVDKVGIKFTNEDAKVNSSSNFEPTDDGRYKAIYTSIPAQLMNDRITAEIVTGEKVLYSLTRSVRQYCDTIYGNAGSTLDTLLANMLRYGAMMQLYVGYRTAELANAGWESRCTSYVLPDSKPAKTGHLSEYNKNGAYISGSSVTVSNVNYINFKIVANDVSKLTIVLYCNGDELGSYNVCDLTYDSTAKKYILRTDAVYANGFDAVFEVKLYRDGELLDDYANSVNGYVYSVGQNASSYKDQETLLNVVKSLYAYGTSAKEYTRTH